MLSVHAQAEVEDKADDEVADDPDDHEEADVDHGGDEVKGHGIVALCQDGQLLRRVVLDVTHDGGVCVCVRVCVRARVLNIIIMCAGACMQKKPGGRAREKL